MGTRSAILAQTVKNGKIKGFYCHLDGYLSHVGHILLDNYPDLEKVEELMHACQYGCISLPLAADLCSSNENVRNEENKFNEITDTESPEEAVNSFPMFIEYVYLWEVDVGRWMAAKPYPDQSLWFKTFHKGTTEENFSSYEDEDDEESEYEDESFNTSGNSNDVGSVNAELNDIP